MWKMFQGRLIGTVPYVNQQINTPIKNWNKAWKKILGDLCLSIFLLYYFSSVLKGQALQIKFWIEDGGTHYNVLMKLVDCYTRGAQDYYTPKVKNYYFIHKHNTATFTKIFNGAFNHVLLFLFVKFVRL